MHFTKKTVSEKRSNLIKNLKSKKLLRFPGAYNPLCAKLIAEIGFDVLGVEIDDKILKNYSVKRSIKIAKKLIKNQGRILVRKSGTEPKIRIMGESENKILLKKCIKMISKEFK